MLQFQLSEATAARRRVPIHLVDQTDGITPETGEAAGQPQLSKNGASFSNTTATLTAIGNGAYYVELTAAELDTVGFGIVRYDSANTAEAQVAFQVVSFDPYDSVRLGLTSLPNAAAEAAGGLYTRGTGAGQINQDANGRVDTNVANMDAGTVTASAIATAAIDADSIATDAITSAKIAAGAITSSEAPNLDAAVSSRATPAQVGTELTTIGLDHLVSAAVVGTDVTDNSIVARMVSSAATADWDTFVNTTDALQAIRDKQTDIETDTQDIQGRLPAALVGGRMDSDVGALQANTITSTVIANDAIGATEIANGAIDAATFAAGAIDAAAIGTGAIDADALATDTITAAKIAAGAITSSEAPNLDAAISTRATPAQVNTEVLDVLNVDTFAEPGQEAPPATTTLVKKIGYLYKAWRNKVTQDTSDYKLFADNTTTVDQKASVTDNGTTFTRNEVGSGP